MDDDFKDVYARSTGRPQRVPAAWLDDPILGRNFVKTPAQRLLDGDPVPDENWLRADLDKYAEDNNILDVADAKTKAEALELITAALEPPVAVEDPDPLTDPTDTVSAPESDNTPAAGDNGGN